VASEALVGIVVVDESRLVEITSIPPHSQVSGIGSRNISIDVSVVVVNYNTAALLEPMRSALLASEGMLTLQLIVIDNASRDNSLAVLRRDFSDALLLVNTANVGFGRANNQALPHLRGRYVLLLNTDAFVAPDTLRKTVAYMDATPACGVLGVRLEGRDGGLQPSCRYFPTPWNMFLARAGLARYLPRVRMVDDMQWDHAGVRVCDWVPGCYYLVRREVIDAVGLFDPRYFMYFEEVDHCLATARAGWQVHYFGASTVVHLGGESAKADADLTAHGKQISALQIESELLFVRKHHGALGSVVNLMLSVLADTWIALKHVVRLRPLPGLQPLLRHQLDLWSLVWRTRLGQVPTR
jgi:N-acetylglucosaminyl-diphospho-decaprenol L-rhamnosyltransferase